jgi:hypothetical protein
MICWLKSKCLLRVNDSDYELTEARVNLENIERARFVIFNDWDRAYQRHRHCFPVHKYIIELLMVLVTSASFAIQGQSNSNAFLDPVSAFGRNFNDYLLYAG